MAVSTDTIAAYSDYVLNTDYTSAQFAVFKTKAEAQFAKDDPGTLSSDERDEAVAMLICHYIARKSRSLSMSEEKIGDYSYKRSTGVTGMPVTHWLEEYKRIISENAKAPHRGVKRADHKTSKAFKLSEQKVPTMDTIDTTLKDAYNI